MNIAVVEGDKRFKEAALKLEKYGFDTKLLGHGKKEKLKQYEILILPVPVSRDKITVNAPLSEEKYTLEEIISSNPGIILGGMITDDFKLKCESKNIKVFDYYKDEALTQSNAILTAEAAVTIAAKNTDRAFYGAEALVIGYGRIGKQLAEIMKVLKANCTCTSRSEKTIEEIKRNGFKAINTENIKDGAEKYDYIFNTAPSPVLDKDFIKKIKDTSFVMDLATSSGTDLKAAENYKKQVGIYPQLPNVCSYLTAADLITNGIIKILKNEAIITEDNLCET